jgi:hypothetical protein
MVRYFFRDIEVTRGEAVRIWRASETYERGKYCEALFNKAENGVDEGGVSNHLAEAGIRITVNQDQPAPAGGGAGEVKEAKEASIVPPFKFKTGDRVVLTCDQHDSREGQEGTVLQNSCAPWVVFDTPTTCDGEVFLKGAKVGFMDCVAEDDLELLPLTAKPGAVLP